jgi:hypothetical protein
VHVIGELTSRQNRQQQELAYQQAQIRSLEVALQGILTQYEFDKLNGLNRDEPFLCYYSDDLHAEVKRLRAMGLVSNHQGTGLGTIRRDYKGRNEQFDLKRFSTSPRPAGNTYSCAVNLWMIESQTPRR